MEVIRNTNKQHRFRFGSTNKTYSKKTLVPSLFIKTGSSANRNTSLENSSCFNDSISPNYVAENTSQKRASISSSNSISTLSSLKSSFTDASSKKTINSKPSKFIPRNHSVLGKDCCFCGEQFGHTFSLGSLFNENKIISLTCGHDAHCDCYLIFMEPYGINELPICTICGRPSKPMNNNDFDKMTELALSGEVTRFIDGFEINIIKSPIVYNDEKFSNPLLDSKVFNILDVSTPINSVLGPINKEPMSVTEYHQDMLINLTKPQIKIIPEYSCFEINESRTTKHSLPLVLNILVSRYPVRQQLLNGKNNVFDLKLEFENYLKISNWIIVNYLSNFNNFKEFDIKPIDFEVSDTNSLLTANEDYETNHNQLSNLLFMDYKNSLSNNYDILIMFDILQVSCDLSDNFEYLQFFLFENDKLLLVKDQNQPILGIIKYQSDLSSIIQIDDHNLVLTFSTMSLDEIKIKSSNKLIITKWKNYLTNILNNKVCAEENNISTCLQYENQEQLILTKYNDVLVPLIQMTNNAWDLLPNNLIPEDMKHIRDLFYLNDQPDKSNIEFPLPLLKKLIPEPVYPPFRFTICISLVNTNPNISNEEYIAQLKLNLEDCFNSLKSANDMLGIVYISYDSSNKFKPYTSSYITDIKDWETLSCQFDNFSKVKTLNEYDMRLNNMEQACLYMEAAERLFEFWGNLKYDEENNKEYNFKYIKKMVMLLDDYNTNEIESLNYDSKKTIQKTIKLLQKIIREFKFTIHCKLVNTQIDTYAIMFANLLIFENYFTVGSSFERIFSLSELRLLKLFQDWKKIIVPTLKIVINSKNSNISLWRNEFRNNFLNLLDLTDESELTEVTSNISHISKTNPFIDTSLRSPLSPSPSTNSFSIYLPTSPRNHNSTVANRSSSRPVIIRPSSPFSPTRSEFLSSPTKSISSPYAESKKSKIRLNQSPKKLALESNISTPPHLLSSAPSSATSSRFSFNDNIFQTRSDMDRSSVSTLNISRIQRMNVDCMSPKSNSTRDFLSIGNESLKSSKSFRDKRTSTSSGFLTSLDICESPISPFVRTASLPSPKFNCFDESLLSFTTFNDSASLTNKDSFEELLQYYFGVESKDPESTRNNERNCEKAIPGYNSEFDENPEQVVIFVNDIKPGFNKNIIINANFEFDKQFKELIKQSINNDPLGINNGFHKCNILLFESFQNQKEITPKTDVNIDICLLKNNNNAKPMNSKYNFNYDEDVTSEYVRSRTSIRHTVNSIIEQQQMIDTFDFDDIGKTSRPTSLVATNNNMNNPTLNNQSIRESLYDQDFELPIFPTPLTNTRDHLYARRQIQLTIISTLIYAVKLAKLDTGNTKPFDSSKEYNGQTDTYYNPNLMLSKSLILGLTSSIFAMGKNFIPKQNLKDGENLEDEDAISSKDDISNKKLKRFVEHMKLILTMIAEMYVSEPNQAYMNSYELIFELCFNM